MRKYYNLSSDSNREEVIAKGLISQGNSLSYTAYALRNGIGANFTCIVEVLYNECHDCSEVAKALKQGTDASHIHIAKALRDGATDDLNVIAWALIKGADANFTDVAFAFNNRLDKDYNCIVSILNYRKQNNQLCETEKGAVIGGLLSKIGMEDEPKSNLDRQITDFLSYIKFYDP